MPSRAGLRRFNWATARCVACALSTRCWYRHFIHSSLRALELDVGVLELRLGLRDRSLLAVYGRLEWRLFERVEQVTFLDVGAFREEAVCPARPSHARRC